MSDSEPGRPKPVDDRRANPGEQYGGAPRVPEDRPLLRKRVFVSRRAHVEDLRPGFVYREEPDDEADSGWRALVGDETAQEVDDPANLLVEPLGALLDRWPDLRPLVGSDPAEGAWAWDDTARAYVPVDDRA